MSFYNFIKLPLPAFINFSVNQDVLPEFVNLRLLIIVRWVIIFSEIFIIGAAYLILDGNLPFRILSIVINLSIIVNALLCLPTSSEIELPAGHLPVYLTYDLAQLTTLLFITGGLNNPFCILILLLVIVAVNMLPNRTRMIVCGLAIFAVVLLIFSPHPLSWQTHGENTDLSLPSHFLAGIASSLIISILFVNIYTWLIMKKTSQLNQALLATQLALGQEQKISSLGALAAAAVHELGSPLSTIYLIGKEILSNLPSQSPLLEDMHLLISQCERCQNILLELSRHASHDYSIACDSIPLSSLIELAARPHQPPNIGLIIRKQALDPQPSLPLTPSLMYGIGNILQNAFQFATSQVQATLRWDKKNIEVIIHDDGPGYPPELLPVLGQFLSPEKKALGRKESRKSENFGLGLFISQTLLSQHQGRIHFSNDAGACCLIRWPRTLQTPDSLPKN